MLRTRSRTDPVAAPRPPAGTAARGEMSRRRTLWVLAVLCSAVGLVIASVTSLYVVGAAIARDTGANETQLTWIVDAYTLAMAGLLLPAGALGDRYGRRGVMIVGLVIFVAAAAWLQLVHTPGALIAARVVLGIGAALILPSTLSLITSTFPREFRDTAVAIWTAAFSITGVLGGTAAAVLVEFFSWRSAFWSVLVGAVIVLAVSPTLPSSREPRPPRIDLPGSALPVVAITALVYGFIEAGIDGWGSTRILSTFVLAGLAAAAFVLVELRANHPILDVRLFADRSFALAAFTVMLCFGGVYGLAFLIFPLQQFVFGSSALAASFPMSTAGVALVPLTIVASRIVDAIGLRAVAALGCASIAAGFVVLATFGQGSPRWLLFLAPLGIGGGMGLTMAPCTSAIMERVPEAKQGVAASVNHTVREVGTALGVALFGGLISSFYTAHIRAATTALPAAARARSRHSLPEALRIAEELGLRGAGLAHAARAAYTNATQQTALVTIVVMGCAAAVCLAWTPRSRRVGDPARYPTIPNPP